MKFENTTAAPNNRAHLTPGQLQKKGAEVLAQSRTAPVPPAAPPVVPETAAEKPVTKTEPRPGAAAVLLLLCLWLASGLSTRAQSTYTITNDLPVNLYVMLYSTNNGVAFVNVTNIGGGTNATLVSASTCQGVGVAAVNSSMARLAQFAALPNPNTGYVTWALSNAYAAAALTGTPLAGSVAGAAPAFPTYAGQFVGDGSLLTNLMLPPAAAITLDDYTNNIIASSWNPNQWQFATPPKGASMWFEANGTASESAICTLVQTMVNKGMVANGYDTLLLDLGSDASSPDSPFAPITNGVPYPALTNGLSAPWLDFRADYFPHGAAWLVSMCHSNRVKLVLYAFNGTRGGVVETVGTNQIWGIQPGFFGSAYYMGWLSNAVTTWHIDGLKDEVSGGNYTNAIIQQAMLSRLLHNGQPFWVNVATPSGYQPWYRGLFSSWRIGVGIVGDVTALVNYYVWLDNTPFGVSGPGAFNDEDEYGDCRYWPYYGTANGQLAKNKLAMDSMANAPILLEGLETTGDQVTMENASFANFAQPPANYYDAWRIPAVTEIDNDFGRCSLVSTNSVYVYAKQLKTGIWAFAAQNRSSTTPETVTINLTNYYQSASGVFSIHDNFYDSCMAVVTNTYTATVATNDVAWFKVLPGIEQRLTPGTNLLATFPWGQNYRPYNGLGIITGVGQSLWGDVNNAYFGSFTGLPAPFRGSSSYPTNNSFIEFTPQVTNNVSWNINGNATLLTANMNGWADLTDCQFFGDGVLITNIVCTNSSNYNIAVPLTGVQTLTLIMTNTAGAYVYLGDPVIYCPTQTKYDLTGNPTTTGAVGQYSGTFTGTGIAHVGAVSPGGITNTLAVSLRVFSFSGSSVVWSNPVTKAFASMGYVTNMCPTLQPGEMLYGSGCTISTNVAW